MTSEPKIALEKGEKAWIMNGRGKRIEMRRWLLMRDGKRVGELTPFLRDGGRIGWHASVETLQGRQSLDRFPTRSEALQWAQAEAGMNAEQIARVEPALSVEDVWNRSA